MIGDVRATLKAKQAALASARQARDKTAAGLERAVTIAAGLVAEGETLAEVERAETTALTDALRLGEDPPKGGTKKSAYLQRVDLESRQRGIADAVAALEAQLAADDGLVEATTADEAAAIDGVLADYIVGQLAEAQELFTAIRELLPELNVAAAWRLDVAGLREFINLPADKSRHEIAASDPSVASAAAKMRAWRTALAAHPGAAIDGDEVATIQRANAAEIAAAAKRVAEDEARYEAERAQEREALQSRNREAEAARIAEMENGLRPRFG